MTTRFNTRARNENKRREVSGIGIRSTGDIEIQCGPKDDGPVRKLALTNQVPVCCGIAFPRLVVVWLILDSVSPVMVASGMIHSLYISIIYHTSTTYICAGHPLPARHAPRMYIICECMRIQKFRYFGTLSEVTKSTCVGGKSSRTSSTPWQTGTW